jgi:hypothetical protein
MEQGFFLDRIHILGNQLPVDQRIEFPPMIFPNSANPLLPLLDAASMMAEKALNFLVTDFLIK